MIECPKCHDTRTTNHQHTRFGLFVQCAACGVRWIAVPPTVPKSPVPKPQPPVPTPLPPLDHAERWAERVVGQVAVTTIGTYGGAGSDKSGGTENAQRSLVTYN